MTTNPDQPQEDVMDDIVLDLIREASTLRSGMTINADMFPETKQAIRAAIAECLPEPRDHSPDYCTPSNCICNKDLHDEWLNGITAALRAKGLL